MTDSYRGKTDHTLGKATYLNPEVAESIAAQSVFLNIEMNRGKIEGGQPTDGYCVDVMFGLVAQYSGEPVIEEGKLVSPMRAVIYRMAALVVNTDLHQADPASRLRLERAPARLPGGVALKTGTETPNTYPLR
jgi:hypothetical protein